MSPPLSVVSDQSPSPSVNGASNAREARAPGRSLAERISRLQAEARSLAREHIGDLQAALVEAERLAAEVATGGDAYPPGVRDIARRLAEELGPKVQTIATLSGRA